jgi:hypothetical protein
MRKEGPLPKKEPEGEYYEEIRIEREPPIREGEIFDPNEELERVRLIHDRSERRRALEEYKDKLAYQKDGLAEMQAALIMKIRENPSLKRGQFMATVEHFGRKYGFTDEQFEAAEYIFNKYLERHAHVEQFLKRYPDNEERFKQLFGAEPKGRIEVIPGPMTIYFRCHDPDDFSRIAFYSRNYAGKGEDHQPSQEQKSRARSAYGVFQYYCRDENLNGAIIAENTHGIESTSEASTVTRTHEEQHAMRRFMHKANIEWLLINDLEEVGRDKKKLKSALGKAARSYFDWSLERAKDEILAYLKSETTDQTVVRSFILRELMRREEEGGAYDYIKRHRDMLLSDEYMRDTISVLGSAGIDKEGIKRVMQEAVEEVFDREEYRKIIERAIDSFNKLSAEYGKFFKKDDVIAIFLREPLERWPVIARRQLEAREKRRV